MSNKIERINVYDDKRFDNETLRQHGAFIVDERYKCSFKIISEDSSIILFDKEVDVLKLIDEFRFYSEHITNFYDKDMNLIKAFPPVELSYISIKDIQPSQFYVDRDKVKAIETFIGSEDDITIPVAKINNIIISMDGHTRLYYAASKGYSKVKAYFTAPGDYLYEFAMEARKLEVYSPYELKLVSHAEYKIKWHQFCDDFFKQRE